MASNPMRDASFHYPVYPLPVLRVRQPVGTIRNSPQHRIERQCTDMIEDYGQQIANIAQHWSEANQDFFRSAHKWMNEAKTTLREQHDRETKLGEIPDICKQLVNEVAQLRDLKEDLKTNMVEGKQTRQEWMELKRHVESYQATWKSAWDGQLKAQSERDQTLRETKQEIINKIDVYKGETNQHFNDIGTVVRESARHCEAGCAKAESNSTTLKKVSHSIDALKKEFESKLSDLETSTRSAGAGAMPKLDLELVSETQQALKDLKNTTKRTEQSFEALIGNTTSLHGLNEKLSGMQESITQCKSTAESVKIGMEQQAALLTPLMEKSASSCEQLNIELTEKVSKLRKCDVSAADDIPATAQHFKDSCNAARKTLDDLPKLLTELSGKSTALKEKVESIGVSLDTEDDTGTGPGLKQLLPKVKVPLQKLDKDLQGMSELSKSLRTQESNLDHEVRNFQNELKRFQQKLTTHVGNDGDWNLLSKKILDAIREASSAAIRDFSSTSLQPAADAASDHAEYLKRTADETLQSVDACVREMQILTNSATGEIERCIKESQHLSGQIAASASSIPAKFDPIVQQTQQTMYQLFTGIEASSAKAEKQFEATSRSLQQALEGAQDKLEHELVNSTKRMKDFMTDIFEPLHAKCQGLVDLFKNVEGKLGYAKIFTGVTAASGVLTTLATTFVPIALGAGQNAAVNGTSPS
eukprot:gb/GFBE01046051.1/.p1 GENE.gb/GFBE01046051.1/~~gb/GFBE01046051.1/.p1  ORF type:complete len:701 (+),score=129.24 gb/GFBE01046051.1/:1-2103(+)